MNRNLAACFLVLSQLFAQCAVAADVMPIWQNDTAANTISFNDTFGHQISIGSYNSTTGAWAVSAGSISVGETFTGGLISVAGSPVTGSGTLALTVAGTSGGIPYFSSASAWASSAALASGSLVQGGGAGVAPSTFTLGGDCTFASPSITCTKTSGVALGTFATQNYATPPAIGGTTPAAGAFTTLSASGAVSGAGFTSLFASPPSIGGTAANSGAFTTLTSSAATTLEGWPRTLDSFGTVDCTGATDMSTLINTATGSLAGTLPWRLLLPPACNLKITSSLVTHANVIVDGAGTDSTTITVGVSPAVAQPSGTQFVHGGFRSIRWVAGSGQSGATIFSFTAIQDAHLDDLQFSGFTTGTIENVAAATVTTFKDTAGMWNSSNSIFNEAHNWNWDNVQTVIQEQGLAGGTTTSSPPSSCNQPAIVATLNKWDNLNGTVSGKAFDFVADVDHETITNATIFLNSNSARMAMIGDQNGTCVGNNYVNNITIQGVAALFTPATAISLFEFGNWTFGNQFVTSPNDAPSLITQYVVDAGVTQAGYQCLGCGNYDTLLTIGGFGATAEIFDCTFCFMRITSGSLGQPAYGYNGDRQTGNYLKAAGVQNFQASGVDSVQMNKAGIVALGTPPINSGSCAINTQLGGNTAGSFKANGSCAGGTYILTFAAAAPNDWACEAYDRTTLSDTVKQSGTASTTSATFTATTASADLVTFDCVGF